MIISHKHKFIFTNNGRSGSTSISRALAPYNQDLNMNKNLSGLWSHSHIPAAAVKGLLPKKIWESYFTFVFVRHPIDWFLSQYAHNASQFLKWHERRKYIDVEHVEKLHARLKIVRALPLEETLFQSNYVCDADGKQIVDFVGRLENIDQDIKKIQKKIGIVFDVQHVNKSKKKYQLTPQAQKRVRELWKKDFDRFGY